MITTIFLCSFFTWQGWTAIAAVIALVYTIFTFLLLRTNQQLVEKSNTLAEYKIYRDIAKDLNSLQVRTILKACKDKNISIDSNGNTMIEGIDYNFRLVILDPLEDLEKFRKDALISLNSINYGFGFLILTVGNQSCVEEFIKIDRKNTGDPSLYEGFLNLYKLIKEKHTSKSN